MTVWPSFSPIATLSPPTLETFGKMSSIELKGNADMATATSAS
jgi:hypothetical protein